MFIWPNELQDAFVIRGVTCRANNFSVDFYHQRLFSEYGIHRPDSISKSVFERQAEYLAGRICAIQAINIFDSSVIDVPIGLNRCPVTPDHIMATITHADNIALSMAAPKDCVHFLGVDLEKIIEEKIVNEIQMGVVNEQEVLLLQELGLDFSVAFSIVFSAKESLFKALYPFVNRYFDFSVVNIVELNETENTVKFRLIENLTPSFVEGRQIDGVFHLTSSHVLTCIYEQ